MWDVLAAVLVLSDVHACSCNRSADVHQLLGDAHMNAVTADTTPADAMAMYNDAKMHLNSSRQLLLARVTRALAKASDTGA